MSGFDTSQPITDEAVLRDGDDKPKAKIADADEDDEVVPEELGDATPGPR